MPKYGCILVSCNMNKCPSNILTVMMQLFQRYWSGILAAFIPTLPIFVSWAFMGNYFHGFTLESVPITWLYCCIHFSFIPKQHCPHLFCVNSESENLAWIIFLFLWKSMVLRTRNSLRSKHQRNHNPTIPKITLPSDYRLRVRSASLRMKSGLNLSLCIMVFYQSSTSPDP